MKPLDTIRINDAANKKEKFNRSRTHLTTLEFTQIVPIFHEDLVLGDSYVINNTNFSRMAPLAVPTYGTSYFKTASFFVPYYQVFEGAESFFSGKNVSRGQSIHLPVISKLEFLRIFYNNSTLATTVSQPSDSSMYDFEAVYTGSSVTHRYFKFTPYGKYVYKVLRSLGYQIPRIWSNTDSLASAPNANVKLNALPLLCFFKAYNDFMSQSQRFDTSILTSYLESIRLSKDISGMFTASTGALTGSFVKALFDEVYLQYENDYFTSCWNKPNNPINEVTGIENVITFVGNNNAVGSITQATYDQYTNNTAPLTARTIQFLDAFNNWVRRNNYSGSKDVEKIFSRFGIKPEDYKAQYAHILNTSSSIVSVGDVTSLADTQSSVTNNGAVLGDYAGKGIINSDTSFKFDCPDYGMLITLAWINVKPVYADGFDRTVLKTDPLDFFNPEFDGLGGNPVSEGELFVQRKALTSMNVVPEESVFGFNERYDEYKTGNLDQITGDFCIFNDMSSWHFNREDLQSLSLSRSLVAQSSSFNSVSNSSGASQFNRIFNTEADSNSNSDHFYCTCQFEVTAFRPMKNMNQVPDLGEGNTVVARNGNQLN